MSSLSRLASLASRGFNQAKRGLYGGKTVGFGNQISHSQVKTRRIIKPNVQRKWLLSETLDEWHRFRVTTHALRCIKKAGGLDQYLLKSDDKELLYPVAIDMRERIKEVRAERKAALKLEAMKIDGEPSPKVAA